MVFRDYTYLKICWHWRELLFKSFVAVEHKSFFVPHPPRGNVLHELRFSFYWLYNAAAGLSPNFPSSSECHYFSSFLCFVGSEVFFSRSRTPRRWDRPHSETLHMHFQDYDNIILFEIVSRKSFLDSHVAREAGSAAVLNIIVYDW